VKAFPQAERTNYLGPQFIVVVPRQEFQISIVEKRTQVGGSLATVDRAPPEQDAEVGQQPLRTAAILNTYEYVVQVQSHSGS
jgi:hypothetical protein